MQGRQRVRALQALITARNLAVSSVHVKTLGNVLFAPQDGTDRRQKVAANTPFENDALCAM